MWRMLHLQRQAASKAYVAMVAYATPGFNSETSGDGGICNVRLHLTNIYANLRLYRIYIHRLNCVNEMLNFVSSAFLARLAAKSVPNCVSKC